MAYLDGFVIPVPTSGKEAYIAHAREAWSLFKEAGATGYCECWGDDVPDGKVTSFPMAVKTRADETVVFGWVEWPDKAMRDACAAAMQTDPRWAEMSGGKMPFDGKRMIFGGFDVLLKP